MCGEIKPYQHKHEVVIRMKSPAVLQNNTNGPAYLAQPNPASVTIMLNQTLEQIEEVWLTEYDAEMGAVPAAGNMWRLSFQRSHLSDSMTCNSAGNGIPFNVNLGVAGTHVVYQRPRVMSVEQKSGGITSLSVDVFDEFGQPPPFSSLTFYLTFVMRRKDWDPAQVMRNDANQVEWWRSNNNVGRMIV